MKKINTTYWKEFALNSLFDIVLSKGDIQAKRMREGGIPLVSSGKFNNGICAYIADGDGKAEIFNADVITTDMFGKSYYQDKPFYAVSHGRVNMLLPYFKMNHYIAEFIVSVLDASFLTRYSFSGMCSQSQLKKEKILLPSTSDGSPDWQYMEDYMHRIEQRTKTAISAFVTSKNQQSKIDTTYWRPFPIGKFFDFQRGKVKKLQSLEKGNVPVIAAARNKQGVAGYYGVEPSYKDQITISCNGVGCGSTFYHDYPFNVNGDAIVSIDKMHISAKAKQFICCILDGVLTRKYSYEEKCSPEKASNEKILLPATPAGEPDWRYMEMYMRGVEAIAKEKISLLTRKNQESNNKTVVHYHINAENISLQTEGTINIGEINEK